MRYRKRPACFAVIIFTISYFADNFRTYTLTESTKYGKAMPAASESIAINRKLIAKSPKRRILFHLHHGEFVHRLNPVLW